MKKIIFVLPVLFLVLQACKKTATIPDRFTPTDVSKANLKILNLSPDAPLYNIIMNGQKVTASTPTITNAEQGLGFGGIYPGTIAYASVPSGAAKLEATVIDSSIVMPKAVLLTSNVNLEAGKFYTLVVNDSINKITTTLIPDDPTVGDTSKAYFRVGNFVSSTPAIKIEFATIPNTPAFNRTYATVPYKEMKAFELLEVPVGISYRVFLKNSVTDEKLDSITTFLPVKTKKYTFYTRGVFGQTGTSTRRPLIFVYTNF